MKSTFILLCFLLFLSSVSGIDLSKFNFEDALYPKSNPNKEALKSLSKTSLPVYKYAFASIVKFYEAFIFKLVPRVWLYLISSSSTFCKPLFNNKKLAFTLFQSFFMPIFWFIDLFSKFDLDILNGL